MLNPSDLVKERLILVLAISCGRKLVLLQIKVKNLLTVDPENAVPLRKMMDKKNSSARKTTATQNMAGKSNAHAADKTNGKQLIKKSPPATSAFKKRHRGCSFWILDIENIPEFPSDEDVGVITMEDVIEELLQDKGKHAYFTRKSSGCKLRAAFSSASPSGRSSFWTRSTSFYQYITITQTCREPPTVSKGKLLVLLYSSFLLLFCMITILG